MTDPEPPCPFGVAVVAACGLDAPGLADTLERVLLRLTSKHRHRPIVVTTVMFQALSRAAGEACGRRGWREQWVIPHPAGSRDRAVLRESVALVATAEAVVILTGVRAPDSTRRLVALCAWLGTPHRIVRV